MMGFFCLQITLKYVNYIYTICIHDGAGASTSVLNKGGNTFFHFESIQNYNLFK